jgi:hypothetical protein
MRDAGRLPIRVPPACRSSTSRPIVYCYTNRAVQPVKSRALTSVRVISLDYSIHRESSVHKGSTFESSDACAATQDTDTDTSLITATPSSLASSSIPNFSSTEASRGGSHVPSTSPMWFGRLPCLVIQYSVHRDFHAMIRGVLRASERRPSQIISDISDPPVYVTCQVAG